MDILDSMIIMLCMAGIIFLALAGGTVLLSNFKRRDVVTVAEMVFIISTASFLVCMLALLIVAIIKTFWLVLA